eukprot:scaffold91767_cov75-Cyclotella_meneghiniana.AAC.2
MADLVDRGVERTLACELPLPRAKIVRTSPKNSGNSTTKHHQCSDMINMPEVVGCSLSRLNFQTADVRSR